MRIGPWDLRSLRLRAILVVASVTVAPLLLVAVASWLEGVSAFDLEHTCGVVTDALSNVDRSSLVAEA